MTEVSQKNIMPPCAVVLPQENLLGIYAAPGKVYHLNPASVSFAEDVLLHFGETKKVARRRYREFVKKGIDQGARPEFQGGGLARGAGGDKRGLLGRSKEERDPPDSLEAPDGGRGKGDARILGSGDFVTEALMKAGKDWEKGKKALAKYADLRNIAN